MFQNTLFAIFVGFPIESESLWCKTNISTKKKSISRVCASTKSEKACKNSLIEMHAKMKPIFFSNSSIKLTYSTYLLQCSVHYR